MRLRPLLILFILLMLGLPCITGQAAAQPKTSIRVVLDDNYPPYIFRDANGQIQGILKDLWDLWQQRTGVTVDFQPMDWGKARATMESGHADVIDTIFDTAERRKIYDFSRPYASIEVPIFFHKSIAGITDAKSLKGFTIGVKDGDACIDYLRANGITEFKRYPSYESQVKAAIRQEIRVLCIDKPPAYYFFNREGAADEFRHSAPLYVGEFHWAVAKGRTDIKRLVEDGFSRITANERTAIETRWLGEPLTTGLWPGIAHYGGYVLLGVLLIIVTLAAWNGALRRRVSARTRELSTALHSLNEQVAEQHRVEAKLVNSETFLRTLIRAIPDLVWLKDPEGAYLFCNHRFERFFGTEEKNIVGKTDYDFVGKDQADFFREHDKMAMAKGSPSINEEWITFGDDGHRELLETTKTPIHDAHGHLMGVLGIGHDITERKEHENKLNHIAHYDVLTTLPNRVLLADRMHQAMLQASRRKQLLAVAYLDLDGFKAINDHHGHEVGDQLLIALSSRMKLALREADTLARLGGDEFVAVLLDLQDTAACVQILARLLEAAAEPWHHGELVLQVSASLGVTFYPQTEEVDADQLLRQADQAMYQAKLAGKNRYHIFDAEQDRSVRGRHESLERIRHALTAREFVLYYQPKVNMRTGKMVGAEALIRWQHPEKGLLPPAMFLPTIEDHPQAIEIGEWVINTALTQMAIWREAGLDIPVSVNIGARQLQQADFVDRLRAILAIHPETRPNDLELEVLETSALEDIARVSEVIESCRAIGILFSLDDFGTGYSSLTYLKRLAVSQLKIDQSFVRDMLDDPDDLAILSGVLSLATAFQRKVIAEGVETEEHGAMLLQLGCELAQGYGIARPMPGAAIPGWAQSWQPDPGWSNLHPVNRNDLPLLFASVEHRAWMIEIENFLKGECEHQPMDHHSCRFGNWLETEGQELHGIQADFQAIKSLHRQMHSLAVELCERHAQGLTTQTSAGLDQLHALRDAWLAQLKALTGQSRK
ncbi:MAG: EAL domain-containing protein [Formivibrio sp.]|nr:EAL domain-containing protein [Formivibrio sp.]